MLEAVVRLSKVPILKSFQLSKPGVTVQYFYIKKEEHFFDDPTHPTTQGCFTFVVWFTLSILTTS